MGTAVEGQKGGALVLCVCANSAPSLLRFALRGAETATD